MTGIQEALATVGLALKGVKKGARVAFLCPDGSEGEGVVTVAPFIVEEQIVLKIRIKLGGAGLHYIRLDHITRVVEKHAAPGTGRAVH